MIAILNVVILGVTVVFLGVVIWLTVDTLRERRWDHEWDDHDDERSMREFEDWQDRLR
jgi:hypothetical protein